MFKFTSMILAALLTACSVSSSPLDKASEKYRSDRDYKSLQIIYEHLSVGITRNDVESLLGEPDYSPTDGLYYYSSDQRVFLKDQNRYTSPGLVVDYRDKRDVPTETLQRFQLRNVGE
ncbi:MAG TPA: hypothetical protein ENJ80_12445 [Gammaproteobacteria bacterium]|nr:hypothetical protein [Gammaproteobacteria bacterium]